MDSMRELSFPLKILKSRLNLIHEHNFSPTERGHAPRGGLLAGYQKPLRHHSSFVAPSFHDSCCHHLRDAQKVSE
jgi:hypothetical protein